MPTSFKGKCPNCGREVLLMSHKDTRYCDRICESEYKYKQKNPRFQSSKKEE